MREKEAGELQTLGKQAWAGPRRAFPSPSLSRLTCVVRALSTQVRRKMFTGDTALTGHIS